MKTKLAVLFLALLGAGGSLSAQQQVQPVAGVLTLNLVPGVNSFKVILGANVTSTVITNPTPGTIISVIFTENATGGFTVAFGGNIANPCSVTTTANTTTTCQFQYDATTNIWNGIGSGGGGISSATGVYLSPNCAAGSVTAPCINIPSPGGCFQGGGAVTTANSPTITFVSGFPTNPPPQVGQLAWVMLLSAGAVPSLTSFCDSGYNSTLESLNFSASNYCGKALSSGGVPLTISSIVAGTSITLSGNCQTTQNGTNAVFFYGPNIYSQMVTACSNQVGGVALGGSNVHVAQGLYVLDNTGNGTQSACGCVQLSGCTPNTYTFSQLGGEGQLSTGLYTPPWYNHGGDLGTVLAGGILHDIQINGTWTFLGVGIGRGTIYDGNPCGSHDFAIVGYNITGTPAGTSETIYPNSANAPQIGSCEMHNFYLVSGDSGIMAGGHGSLVNGIAIIQNPAIADPGNGTVNQPPYRMIGGFYQSKGRNRSGGNAGVIALPIDGSTATGDKFTVQNADLCMTGNAAAVTDTETSGELQFTNVRINQFCSAGVSLGTNAGGLTLASGITAVLYRTQIAANGTGNTINNPTGATVIDNCGNTASGGAGYTGSGAYGGPCYTLGPAPAASNIALGAGYATTGAPTGFTTSAVDSRRHFTFTLTLAGAPALANETITYTFPAPFDVAPGTCRASVVGGTQFAAAPFSFLTTTLPSTTSVVFTQQTAAGTAGNTEIISVDCG